MLLSTFSTVSSQYIFCLFWFLFQSDFFSHSSFRLCLSLSVYSCLLLFLYYHYQSVLSTLSFSLTPPSLSTFIFWSHLTLIKLKTNMSLFLLNPSLFPLLLNHVTQGEMRMYGSVSRFGQSLLSRGQAWQWRGKGQVLRSWEADRSGEAHLSPAGAPQGNRVKEEDTVDGTGMEQEEECRLHSMPDHRGRLCGGSHDDDGWQVA